jgi:peptide/nickel transport system substrate-binding protein
VTTRRNASKRTAGLPLCALLLACAAAAGESGCRDWHVPHDELVVLIEAPPQTPDPRFAVTAYDWKLSRLLYAALVSVDNVRAEPQMDLADSVRALDAHTWEIVLRDGARFSDGTLVTSDDVLYTIQSILDPATGSRLRERFRDDGLERIEVVDARRLKLHLQHAHAPFVTDLDVGILKRPPAPLARGALHVGAGPFVFAARDGESWRIVRNPHYYRGAPAARAVTFKVIRDDNSRLLALVGGSGDLTQNTIAPILIDAVEKQPRLQVETGRSSTYSYVGLNCDDPILKDVRVRRAIAYAIDRKLLIDTKLRGRAVLATAMLPTFHWAYEPSVERYDYDPARARRLLDEAGYPDPDGDGPEPRFTIIYKTSNNRFRVAVAQAIATMLREVGIGVELRVNEFATFFADVKKGNYQMFTMQIPEIVEPDLYTTFFASTRIPTREAIDAGANRVRYRNPELDRLLDRGRIELDVARRKAIYGDVQRILARDVPVISLWHDDNVLALRRGVKGFEIYPTAQLTSLARTFKE